MKLQTGQRVGTCEIVAPLGEGGMGEVYRARDTKLQRDVAVKVLPELFAADPERLARFTREAQTLAALNHPNIAQIYGVVDHPAALVMEFADGEDLSAIIARGPLPIAEALAITRQIGDALEAAHEQGIVHRDLKPANIKVKADGTVKVLDFGLAKAMDPAASLDGSADRANSPTFTAQYTQMGVVLGTAAYMAPEQARGRAVDKRADIWAFGIVLFEMLTGRQTFGGDTISEVTAAVMKDDPDWTRLPPGLPPQVMRLLRRCLVKDPKQRLRDIGDARLLLDDSEVPAPSTVDRAPAPRRRGIGIGPALALLAIAVIATTAAVWFARRASAPPAISGSPHLHVALDPGDEISLPDVAPVAISPDGARIAYTVRHNGHLMLFARALADAEPAMLEGTDGAASPFFSPDGQWIGFFANGTLKKVSVTGASVQRICDAPNARGGTWTADGQIYFAPSNISGIQKVSASGSGEAPVQVTTLDRDHGEISHRWPLALPDGKTLLFTVWTGPGPDERALVRQSLATGERHVLVRGGDRGRYLPDGYLIYARLDGLYAVPWTPSEGEVRPSAPIALPEVTAHQENEGAGAFDVSANGTLVTLAGGKGRYTQRLVWVDRSGKIEPLPEAERDYEGVWLSPDGSRAIVQIREGTMGLWIYDFARRTMTPLTGGAGGSSQVGVWTPDGRRVIYRATRNGTRNLYWRAADGSGDEQRVGVSDAVQTPSDVSRDGRWVIFREEGASAGSGRLMQLRLDGPLPGQAQLLVTGTMTGGQLSPDGKWLAYGSRVADRVEIYVQPYPGPGPRTQISVDGGTEPLWSRDGRELFFQSGDRLMAVPVTTSPSFSAGTPHVIVQGRFRPAPNARTPWDVAADGRFLRIQQVEPERPLNRLDIVLDWIAEVARAAAVR